MGQEGLPHIFIDDEAETPSASKWNDDFEFLNFTHQNELRNVDFEQFAGGSFPFWTLAGAGAIQAQVADPKHGDFAAQITFGVADSYLWQATHELNFLKGRRVRAIAWVKATAPNQARIKVTDGVATSASVYHSGSGLWEQLVIEHEVSAVATSIRLELHVEVAGSVKFDAVAVFDSRGVNGFHHDHPSGEIITKEAFFQVEPTDVNLGNYRAQAVASAGAFRVVFNIPWDVTTITKAVLVTVNSLTAGPQTVQLVSSYGKQGELYTAATESNLVNTYSYVANQIMELNIKSVLAGAQARDFVGILATRVGAGFGTLNVLGVLLKYD